MKRERLKNDAIQAPQSNGGGIAVLRLCPAEYDENAVFVNKVMSDPVIGRMIARRLALALAPAYRNRPHDVPETLRREDRRKFRPSGGAA